MKKENFDKLLQAVNAREVVDLDPSVTDGIGQELLSLLAASPVTFTETSLINFITSMDQHFSVDVGGSEEVLSNSSFMHGPEKPIISSSLYTTPDSAGLRATINQLVEQVELLTQEIAELKKNL